MVGNHLVKIALVNPQIATTSWNTPLVGSNATSVRFSLAYLSASLKAAGHEVILIDTRLLSGWREYGEIVKKHMPDFLGVTMHTCEFDVAIDCCRNAKKINQEIKTCVGGIHPTMFPKQSLNTKVVDYVLRGEGEVSFIELVENPDNFSPSFWGKSPNLDEIPFADRNLWPDYKNRIQVSFIGDLSPPLVEMLTGRGCPYKCSFCCGPGEQNVYSIEKNGVRVPNIRQRSVKNVIEELLQLHNRYKFKSIVFHDDQFLINPEWVRNFCAAMHDNGLVEMGVEWWAASRSNLIVKFEKLLKLMKEAGLKILSVGYESFSDRMLKWLNKGTTVEQNWKATEILNKLGIDIYGNFIFGIPYSDGIWYPKDDIKTAKAIKKMNPKYCSLSFFTPIPGSYLYKFSVEKKLLLSSKSKSLGLRNPSEAKIKGIDYNFLNRLISSVTGQKKSSYQPFINILEKLGLYGNIKEIFSSIKSVIKNKGPKFN